MLAGGVAIVVGITRVTISGSVTTVLTFFLCGLLFLGLLKGTLLSVGTVIVLVGVLVGLAGVGAFGCWVFWGLGFLLWGLLLLEWLCWIGGGWSLACESGLLGFRLGERGALAIVGWSLLSFLGWLELGL